MYVKIAKPTPGFAGLNPSYKELKEFKHTGRKKIDEEKNEF